MEHKKENTEYEWDSESPVKINRLDTQEYVDYVMGYRKVVSEIDDNAGEYNLGVKILGVPATLTYRNGKLINARMDNRIGIDITEKIKTILDIPKNIPLITNVDEIVVRCVVYITYENYKGKKDIKNYTNKIIELLTSCGGSNNLNAHAESIIGYTNYCINKTEQGDELRKLGFTQSTGIVKLGNMEEVRYYIRKTLRNREYCVTGLRIIGENEGLYLYNLSKVEESLKNNSEAL